MGLLLTQLSWVQGPGYPGADDYPANWTYPGQGPLQSAGRSAATLTNVTTWAQITGQADGVSSATLALTAPTQIPFGASAGVSTATLALTAPWIPPPRRTMVSQARERSLRVTHATRTQIRRPAAPAAAPTLTLLSDAVSTATLAITAPTQIPLGASTATSTATLALTAPTRIVLNPSAAVSTATLALTILFIPLGPASHGEGVELLLVRARAREFSTVGAAPSDTMHG